MLNNEQVLPPKAARQALPSFRLGQVSGSPYMRNGATLI
jgi:hypothetical protein